LVTCTNGVLVAVLLGTAVDGTLVRDGVAEGTTAVAVRVTVAGTLVCVGATVGVCPPHGRWLSTKLPLQPS
jgi:uncharacterized protein (UPF0303 family)